MFRGYDDNLTDVYPTSILNVNILKFNLNVWQRG